MTAQDVKEESVPVKLDHLATVDIEFTAIQRATNVDDLNRLFLEPAAVALAEKINADGLGLYADVPYFGGTAGTAPSTLSDFATARKILNANKAPLPMRRGVWDTEADDALYEVLSAPEDSHAVVLPYGQTTLAFDAYVTSGEDTLVRMTDKGNYWKGLKVNLIAMAPQRT